MFCWGENEEEARRAEYDSNCWTNIAPQHHAFHEEIWGKLEEWVQTKAESVDGKQSIFTGPVHMSNDRNNCTDRGDCITIPAAFYKVIFTVVPGPVLRGLAFIIKQDEYWDRGLGRDLHSLKSYQLSLSQLTELTNIRFDEALYRADPLNGPERDRTVNLINAAEDITV